MKINRSTWTLSPSLSISPSSLPLPFISLYERMRAHSDSHSYTHLHKYNFVTNTTVLMTKWLDKVKPCSWSWEFLILENAFHKETRKFKKSNCYSFIIIKILLILSKLLWSSDTFHNLVWTRNLVFTMQGMQRIIVGIWQYVKYEFIIS